MDAGSAHHFSSIHRFFTAWIKFARHRRSQRQIVDEKCNRDNQIAAFASLFVERRKLLHVSDAVHSNSDVVHRPLHSDAVKPPSSKNPPPPTARLNHPVIRPVINANDPVFQRFQQRAEERHARHEALRRRREEQQATEHAAKRLEEEKAMQAQAELKRHDAAERKAKLIREKKAGEQRLAAEAEERIKCGRADEFRNCSLIKYWGLGPWKTLMKQQSKKLISAQEHYRRTQAKRAVTVWKEQTQNTLTAKEEAFRKVFDRLLKRILFDHLRKMKDNRPRDAQFEPTKQIFQRVQQRSFVEAWRNLAVMSQIENHIVNQKCTAMMTRLFKDICFDRWKKLPGALKHERLRNQYMKTFMSIVKKQLRDFILPAEYFENGIYESHKTKETLPEFQI